MSDLIKRDALIADLDKGLWGKDYDKALAEAIIQDAPTIDAVEKKVEVVRCNDCKKVEVVRCRDCKYRETCEQIVWFDIGKYKAIGSEIDFCSRGEREGE